MKRLPEVLFGVGAALLILGWGVGKLFLDGTVLIGMILVCFSMVYLIAIWFDRRSDPNPPRWSLANRQTQLRLAAGFGLFLGIFLLSVSRAQLYSLSTDLGIYGCVALALSWALSKVPKPKKDKK